MKVQAGQQACHQFAQKEKNSRALMVKKEEKRDEGCLPIRPVMKTKEFSKLVNCYAYIAGKKLKKPFFRKKGAKLENEIEVEIGEMESRRQGERKRGQGHFLLDSKPVGPSHLRTWEKRGAARNEAGG